MEKEYRQFQGELRLMETDDPFLFPVELWLLNDAANRNNWRFTDMEGNKNQFAGTPILVAYVNGGRTVGDGHNQREYIDPKTGEPRSSFTAADAERIVGAISEDYADIRTEDRDGTIWIVAKGTLWAWYANELVSKIREDARQGRGMSVSIEALVSKAHMEDGIEIEEEYKILGTTILGDHVMPAVDGAHIAMLFAIGSEFETLKLRAASYRNKPHNNTMNKGVKRSMNLSKQQLHELQKQFGDSYAVKSAEQKNDSVTVLLMRKSDHVFCTYEMGAKDSVIDPERISARSASIVVALSEDETMCLDATECVSEETCEAEDRACALSADVERLNGELTEARNQISAMNERENKRRLSAAKETAEATLADFNANREDKIDAKLLSALMGEIEQGLYTASVNAEGEWTGDKAVKEKVLSICAAEVMEQDKRHARGKEEPITWGSMKRASAAPGTIGELFAAKH